MLKKLGLAVAVASVALVPNVSFANNQAKIDVVKQAYASMVNSSNSETKYFDSSLKKADYTYQHGGNDDPDCIYNPWYDGQDTTPGFMKSLKLKVLANGRVRASYRNGGQAGFTDFTLVQQGGGYKISDIHFKGSGSYKKDLLSCR